MTVVVGGLVLNMFPHVSCQQQIRTLAIPTGLTHNASLTAHVSVWHKTQNEKHDGRVGSKHGSDWSIVEIAKCFKCNAIYLFTLKTLFLSKWIEYRASHIINHFRFSKWEKYTNAKSDLITMREICVQYRLNKQTFIWSDLCLVAVWDQKQHTTDCVKLRENPIFHMQSIEF